MSKIRIAGATLNQLPLDWKGNIHRISDAIQQAKAANVHLLCLPELSITGYGCEDLFLSRWVPEKAMQQLPSIARLCHDITVVVGLPLVFEENHYNAACLIHRTEIVGFYCKQFLANDGVHYEPRWFTPWPAGKNESIELDGCSYPIGDQVHHLHGLNIGFEICEDAWRENRPACRLLDQQVDLILNPSASHFALGKSETREELVISSSEAFRCTYMYVNLLGNEAGRMIYDGEILIAREGQLLKKNLLLSYQDTQLIYTDIDLDKTAPSAPVSLPEHNEQDEFIRAISLALFDYLRKSRSKGFVLSLSGGADSSSCAIAVSEMVKRGLRELGVQSFCAKLGFDMDAEDLVSPEKAYTKLMPRLLTCVYQGTVNSSDETRQSAAALAKEIHATFHDWNIDSEIKGFVKKTEKALGRALSWQDDDITLQNIQSRTRSPGIWMLANVHHALLLVTSNRSEADVGYTTMDGDTSGSLAPIAAVPKFFIRNWLKYAEEELGYRSLAHVNALTPSAELRPAHQSQTDEDDLMPYDILLEIEKLAIRDKLSPRQVYDELSQGMGAGEKQMAAYIIKFFSLWSRNQWKRERFAPAFHLDDFNVDPRTWCRFPILSSGFNEELDELRQLIHG